jgi:hypothetical protein
MVIATLQIQTVERHCKYTNNNTKYKLPLFIETSSRAEMLFKAICKAKSRTRATKVTTNDWISKETYKLLQ